MLKKNQLLVLLLLGTVAVPAFGMDQNQKNNSTNPQNKTNNQPVNQNQQTLNEQKKVEGDQNNQIGGTNEQNTNNDNKDENNKDDETKIDNKNNDKIEEKIEIKKSEGATLKDTVLSSLWATPAELKDGKNTKFVNTYDGTEAIEAATKNKLFINTIKQNDLTTANKAMDDDKTNGTFIIYGQKIIDEKTVTTYYTATLVSITVDNFFDYIYSEEADKDNKKIKYYLAKDVLKYLKYATNLKLTAKIGAIDSNLQKNEHLVYNEVTEQYYVVTIKATDEKTASCFIKNVLKLSKTSEINKEITYSEASINLFVKDQGLTLVTAKQSSSKRVFMVGDKKFMKLQSAHKFFWDATRTTGQTFLSAVLGFLSGFTFGNPAFKGHNQQAGWIAPYATSALCGGLGFPTGVKKTISSKLYAPFTASPKTMLITFAGYAGNIAARALNPIMTSAFKKHFETKKAN